MKFSSTVCTILANTMLVSGFVISPLTAPSATISSTSINAVGVYYDSSTGNTETVAGYIGSVVGVDPQYISDTSEDEMKSADGLIVGAPTWHTGADSERSGTSWDEWLYNTLPNMDLKDKKVAIFGCGDQESYGDYYCDAAGELYDCFTKAGCKVYGFTSTEGYNHVDSKAERDGKFVGVMFDEDNQYDLSEERATKWVEQLKSEGFF